MKDYTVTFEPIIKGDAKNFWETITLNKNIKIGDGSDSLFLKNSDFYSRYTPDETLVKIVAYPSSHEITTNISKDLKNRGYKVSISLKEETFSYSFGYSYYSDIIEAD